MNILMLNYEYPPLGGGGAAVCKELSEKLTTLGHTVTVLTMNMKGLENREIVNGVEIIRVKCIRKKNKVCHPWEQMTYCISAYVFCKQNLNMDTYDIVHCHFIVPTGLLSLWLKKRFGIKYILTAQGSDVLGHNNARFGLLYRLIKPEWKSIVRNAEILTAPSNYLIEKIRDSLSEQKCELIPNGIDLEKYPTKEKTKSIVTLCRLQESKGIQDLLEALAGIDFNGWRVHILGDGPYRRELEKLVFKYGLSDEVIFGGFIAENEKLEYLGKAGLFFSGSRFEAMPISILEAMASSCRIIVSDIVPHRALLNRESIYTDIDELKEKIQKICNEEPNEVEYDMNLYDWNRIVTQYESLYNSCVSQE